MNFNKRVNGSWVDTPNYIHNTSTDTITTLPADIYANDTTATVGLKGNMEQTGTPSPESPVMPQGTGERTGNLAYGRIDGVNIDANGTIGILSGFDIAIGRVESGVTYTANTYVFAFYTNEPTIGSASYDGSRIVGTVGTPSTFTAPITGYVAFRLNPGEQAMLNSGSTAKPYEPYGYKIPISSASTTTPVYLGEVETTREIGKYVFTGEEKFFTDSSALYNNTLYFGTRITFDIFGSNRGSLNSHFYTAPKGNNPQELKYECSGFNPVQTYSGFYYMRINLDRIGSPSASGDVATTAFKTWLAAQYAAGTPVCVWYVLATPTTGIVNEPLRKIGTYADTVSGISIPTIAGANSFDVLTTLKPSEVTVNYKGWHDATVKEWDGSQWNE